MNAQYYIWADGNEQGPMSMQHLMRDWKSGALPKGFLWRRESDETYQSPDALVEEEKPKVTTAPIKKQDIPSFVPSTFSMWLSMVMFAIGFVLALGGSSVGAALMSLAISIIMSTYALNMLRALNEIVRKLHEMDQR
ncbi:MAG: hypothetical protein E6R03_13575 [Hyphomicrobiaceae bacterium]|nr:MAG: hypothetical protein E6R03_13575 [Hyphomicrobiaceae bacterium]